jgi:hypothetical protein
MQVSAKSNTGSALATAASSAPASSGAAASTVGDEYVGRHRPHRMGLLHPRGRAGAIIEHDGAA